MTSTTTAVHTSISQRGDLITITTKTTTTTKKPGEDPVVDVKETVKEYKGEEGYKSLPQEIKDQLENKNKSVKPTSKKAADGDFAKDCLKEHNKYRLLHGSPALKLSKELMAFAEKKAEEFAKKDELSLDECEYGTNLFKLYKDDPSFTVKAKEIVLRWYNEGKDYNYKEEPTELQAGHFTQLLWKGCKEFGIAAAKSDTNHIYVVGCYNPPGNYKNNFLRNVLPLGTEAEKRKPKSSVSSSDDENDFNEDGVKVHNRYRAKHGVPPLKYSKELAKHAQEWANKLAKLDKFEHRKERMYGENLYFFHTTDPKYEPTAEDACKKWYDEIQQYTFGVEPKSNSTGHFTQMIWKETKEVGMGMSKTKTGKHIIVANYNPPGNFIGRYTQNVPKPLVH